MGLIDEIEKLQKTSLKKRIDTRLKQFSSSKNTRKWFSELCFCLLTANSKAKTALQIEKQLGVNGFCEAGLADVRKCIQQNKHRFHNNKAKYIVEARTHIDIKAKLVGKNDFEAREWLVKNIKGLGMKEASHFLRNVGYTDVAIVDRHILNVLVENKMIKEKPVFISKKVYMQIEEKLRKLASSLNMSQAELDLYMWYIKTGVVLK